MEFCVNPSRLTLTGVIAVQISRTHRWCHYHSYIVQRISTIVTMVQGSTVLGERHFFRVGGTVHNTEGNSFMIFVVAGSKIIIVAWFSVGYIAGDGSSSTPIGFCSCTDWVVVLPLAGESIAQINQTHSGFNKTWWGWRIIESFFLRYWQQTLLLVILVWLWTTHSCYKTIIKRQITVSWITHVPTPIVLK